MRNENKEIMSGMPVHSLYNTGGFIPTYIYYEFSTNEFQNIILDFAKGFMPDAYTVSYMYDKNKDRSNEDGCSKLYLGFQEGARSITGKFGSDMIIVGNDNYRSKELTEFLNRFAAKGTQKDGYVGRLAPRKGDALRGRAAKVVGFELNPQPILETIFDVRGTGYSRETGSDDKNNFRTTLKWGECTTNNKVTGIYVMKIISKGYAVDENMNGKYGPQPARSF